MAFQPTSVGVQFPDYLQNPTAGQSRTSGGGNQSPLGWADKNRAAFAKSIGADGFTGDDGRLDYGKAVGALKGFCK